MESVTSPLGRGSVPSRLEDLRLYLLERARGIDTLSPAPLAITEESVGGFTLVTFSWEYGTISRPGAPRPDGFVFWTELASSLSVGFPRLTGVNLPLTARSHQVLLPPGMVLRGAVQTFRAVHRTVEYGEFVQPDDWLASNLSAGGYATAAQGALADSAWQPGDTLTTVDDAYDQSGWDANLEVPTKNAVRDALVGMLSYIDTYTWQPGDPTPAPSNAPSGIAAGNAKEIYSVVISGDEIQITVSGRIVELDWSYTQGAVEADGFLVEVDSGDYEEAVYVGKDARSAVFTIPDTSFVSISVKAFRAGVGGLAFSSASTGAFAISGSSTSTDVKDATKLQGEAIAASSPSDGQVLAYNSGAARWEPATPSSGGGGITWNIEAGTTLAAAVANGYVLTAGSLTTATLPATCAVGDSVRLIGVGTKVKVTANTGQTIRLPWAETTTAGSLTAQEDDNDIELTCVVANTTWNARASGNFGVS